MPGFFLNSQSRSRELLALIVIAIGLLLAQAVNAGNLPPRPPPVAGGVSSLNPGSEIVDQTGWGGFSVTVTRIMTMPDGSVVEQDWTHSYAAAPRIIRLHPCEIPGSSTVCPQQVPSVLGLTWNQAIAALEERGFTIADGGTVEVDRQGQDGLVQSQTPGAGTYQQPGTAVTVVIGSFVPPPTTTTLPPDDSTTTTTTEPPPGDE